MNTRSAAAAALLGAVLAGCATPPAAPPAPKATMTRFPLQGATEVCPDVPLQLAFNEPVALGTTGSIVIKDAAGATADTIDLAAVAQAPAPGGGGFARPPSAISRQVGGVSLR